jgi:hypothetical protein
MRLRLGVAIKPNLPKVWDGKPRVLASYATFNATQDPKIAGLPSVTFITGEPR